MSDGRILDRPQSPIMNNQNDNAAEDFGDFLSLDIPSDLIPEGDLIEACEKAEFDEQGMPIISAEEPYTESPAPVENMMPMETPTLNNQAELMEIEYNMDKLQFNTPQRDLTLTELNGRFHSKFDDENFGFQYETEEKTYEDLSNSNAYRTPEVGGANFHQYAEQDTPMEFELDQKSNFFEFQQSQQPVMVNRMEMAPIAQLPMSNPYQVDQMGYDTKPNFLPSVQCSPAQSIEDYFTQDNNTNFAPSPQYLPDVTATVTSARSSRSRKSSLASNSGGKMMGAKRIIGKVVQEEKPFRQRMTKAEKNKLTPAQLKSRHLEQNKNNAKKCVEKKNNQKQFLAEKEELLKADLKMIQKHNKIQENGLLEAYEFDVFPKYQNNAPFGEPVQFLEQMEQCKDVKIDNNGLMMEVRKLKKDFDEKEAKHQSYQKPKEDPNLPQNTYASQKSRAKTAYELAKLQYSTANLELECEKAMEFGRILEQLTQTVNAHLAGTGHKQLPGSIVYEQFQQFEPS